MKSDTLIGITSDNFFSEAFPSSPNHAIEKYTLLMINRILEKMQKVSGLLA